MSVDAFKWGIVFGVIAAAIITISLAVGVDPPDSPLASDPYRAAGAGFLWGILIFNIREWLIARRPPGP